ncbi:hypothetical protein LCGC14_0752860 [marine sediment metagenome]|uniref:Uncharacterized protein n=1 Tax=marine sediment metagenome TaxID=412755 RepID=A0A0F9QN88_9ZZZZ
MEADALQEAIGGLLAQGQTDEDIIASIIENEQATYEEACGALRSVYDGWQQTREALDLNDTNLQDWHVFLRKHILQTALTANTIPSLKLALGVLDSLATIQGVCAEQGQAAPLTITLVEKKEDPESTDAAVENNEV